MKKIKRYTNRVEEFLHSDAGQRFFNIAYSVGAAIVIWGALFKILHLPGGNALLCIGMGTEIAMFILTAFDRPPKEPNWEELIPALSQGSPQQLEGLTIVDDNSNEDELPALAVNQVAENLGKASELAEATTRFVEAIQGISLQMGELQQAMTSGSTGYAEKMADLNRNLAGLNTIYEIQLKNVSSQLETIDKVNKGLKDIKDMYEKSASESAQYCEEAEKMTKYMRQINAVYEKMITAMTINMQASVNPFNTSEKNQ